MGLMPARFDSLGISFQYPDNWTLDDSDARLGRKSVTVYGPEGPFGPWPSMPALPTRLKCPKRSPTQ